LVGDIPDLKDSAEMLRIGDPILAVVSSLTMAIFYASIFLYVGFIVLIKYKSAKDGAFLGKSWGKRNFEISRDIMISIILLVPITSVGFFTLGQALLLVIIILSIFAANFLLSTFLGFLNTGGIEISLSEPTTDYLDAKSMSSELIKSNLCGERTRMAIIGANIEQYFDDNMFFEGNGDDVFTPIQMYQAMNYCTNIYTTANYTTSGKRFGKIYTIDSYDIHNIDMCIDQSLKEGKKSIPTDDNIPTLTFMNHDDKDNGDEYNCGTVTFNDSGTNIPDENVKNSLDKTLSMVDIEIDETYNNFIEKITPKLEGKNTDLDSLLKFIDAEVIGLESSSSESVAKGLSELSGMAAFFKESLSPFVKNVIALSDKNSSSSSLSGKLAKREQQTDFIFSVFQEASAKVLGGGKHASKEGIVSFSNSVPNEDSSVFHKISLKSYETAKLLNGYICSTIEYNRLSKLNFVKGGAAAEINKNHLLFKERVGVPVENSKEFTKYIADKGINYSECHELVELNGAVYPVHTAQFIDYDLSGSIPRKVNKSRFLDVEVNLEDEVAVAVAKDLAKNFNFDRDDYKDKIINNNLMISLWFYSVNRSILASFNKTMVESIDDDALVTIRQKGWASFGAYLIMLSNTIQSGQKYKELLNKTIKTSAELDDGAIGIPISEKSSREVQASYLYFNSDAYQRNWDNYMDRIIGAEAVKPNSGSYAWNPNALSEGVDILNFGGKSNNSTNDKAMSGFSDFIGSLIYWPIAPINEMIGGDTSKSLLYNIENNCVGGMGKCLSPSKNPLTAMVKFGNRLIDMSVTFLIVGYVTPIIADQITRRGQSGNASISEGSGGALKKAATYFLGAAANIVVGSVAVILDAMLTVLMSAAWALLLLGLFLAYILPLYPFIHYFIAILSWIVTIMATFILIPLWALMYGLPRLSGQARLDLKMVWSMLGHILMKPAILVMSMTFGWVLSSLSVLVLVMMFGVAMGSFTSNPSMISSMINALMFYMLFGVSCYIAVTHSFKAVNTMTDTIFKKTGIDPSSDQQLLGGLNAEKIIQLGVTKGALDSSRGALDSFSSKIKDKVRPSD
jgi:hypothetical protein